MMFAVRPKLDKFFTSYSRIQFVIGYSFFSDYRAHESSKFMQKLITKRGAKLKKKWYQPHIAEPMEVFSLQKPTHKHEVTQAQRTRAIQLSHVLYDRITQIINTGELSEEILNKQVFITSVKMQTNFENMNVYWDSSRSDAVEIEGLLQAHAGKLRSLLISYHVLGRIPPITFVKDQTMGNLIKLKQLFEVADYGPDFVQSSPQSLFKAHTDEARWNFSKESTSSHSLKPYINNSPSAVFTAPDSLKRNSNTDVTTSAAAVEHNCCNGSEFIQSSTGDNENIDFMKGLNFRSNLYGLPHENLMKKVTAHKSKIKNSGAEVTSNTDTHNFDSKQLKSRKDKQRILSLKGSTKLKERLLQMDNEGIIQRHEDDDCTNEIHHEEYDYDETKGN